MPNETVKGFNINGTVVKYDYNSLENKLELDNTLSVANAAADAKVVGSFRADFDEKVNSKFLSTKPTNWLNLNAITDGELYKDGSIGASSTRFYTDFIPVNTSSVIQSFRGDTFAAIYRRHICCFDANKTVIASAGSDNSSTGTYTISLLQNPENVKYVRVTLDKNILSLSPMITLDGVPSRYSAYFEPYEELTEDFLTPTSEAAILKIVEKTLTTKDLSNRYACALPKGYIFRQTVGLPQSWFYSNAVSPITPVLIGVGSEYRQLENNRIDFPNTNTLISANGFTWNVYDNLLTSIDSDNTNVPYGSDRHIVAENLQNCTALVIGDSTVDFDTMTQKMLDYFTSKNKTLTLLGTLGSGNNKNEGRSGWKATDYLTNKTYDGVVNPFYNPNAQTFDFSYYMTNQSYSAPDFVVIQLGINDLYNAGENAIEPTWDAVKIMIDSIRSYNTAIKIILNLPTAPNSDQGEHSVFLPLYQNRVIKYNQYAMQQAKTLYGETRVRPSYCHLILDPSTDISDNVHPTAAGFEKMAHEVINQINCWQNGY